MEHIYYVIWLVGFVGLLIGCGSILGERIRSRTIRSVFIPGFLLTAGLQLLFCEIGRVDKRRVSVVSDKVPPTRRFEGLTQTKHLFMVLGPFIAGFVILATLLWLLDIRVKMQTTPKTELPALFAMMQKFGYTLTDVVVHTLHLIFTAIVALIETGNPLQLLTLYVVVSFLIAMIPPKGEGRRLLVGFALLGVALWLISLVGLKISPGTLFPRRLDGVCATATGFVFWIFIVVASVVRLPEWLAQRKKEEVSVEVEEKR